MVPNSTILLSGHRKCDWILGWDLRKLDGDPVIKLPRPIHTHQRIRFGINEQYIGVGHFDGKISLIPLTPSFPDDFCNGITFDLSMLHGKGIIDR